MFLVLSVTIEGLKGEVFKGFMLQSREKAGKRVGEFMDEDDEETQTDTCVGDDGPNYVTHTSRVDKTEKTFDWKAPVKPGTGTVTFLYVENSIYNKKKT